MAPEALRTEHGEANRHEIEMPLGAPPPKRRRRIWAIAIVLAIVGLIAYRIVTHPQAQGTQSRAGEPGATGPVSVGVAPVRQRDVPYFIAGLGTVAAYYTVTVHTRVDGQIMQVFFREGQFVHTGDALAEIDPRPYEVQLAQAEGQLAKDQAAQKDAQVDLDRYQTLWKEGVIPRQQLDTQLAQVGQYDGGIKADQAQIQNAKLNLTYCHITAPISGRVGLRLVDPGNIVHATDTTGLLVITQLQPIAVDFTLPEDVLPEVRKGMRSRQLTAEAYSRDDKTRLAAGRLETLDNEIDPTTGMFKLKAIFPNKDSALWPNQFVNVHLFLSVRNKALVIPTAAIQKGADSNFVFVVSSAQQAEVRNVNVDFSEGNISVIRSGLSAGDQVVVDGQDKLQQGTKLSPHPATILQNLTTGSAANPGGGLGAQGDSAPNSSSPGAFASP